jgi:antibiotic biosynthesis monooxygenase (ABM) superfamily enzyme
MQSHTTQPVTVVIRRRVRSGRQAEYEAWLERFIQETSSFPGYLGVDVHRPAANAPLDYVSVVRFASVEDLRAFEQSDLRRDALREVIPFVEGDAAWERLTGLEFWFAPPPGAVVPQPSRFRMALLLSALVYGLVLSIGQLVALGLADAPAQARLLLTITIEVFLMVYVLMPWITKHLARFIYPT